jgi:hypothetical protein
MPCLAVCGAPAVRLSCSCMLAAGSDACSKEPGNAARCCCLSSREGLHALPGQQCVLLASPVMTLLTCAGASRAGWMDWPA